MTGRIKNSTEKTSFVVFKYDFCKSRNLSSIEGTLPLDFLEMSSPEKISGMSDWFREGNGQFAEKQENDFGGITEE